MVKLFDHEQGPRDHTTASKHLLLALDLAPKDPQVLLASARFHSQV